MLLPGPASVGLGRAAGRLVFLAGLTLWAAAGFRLIPYDFGNMTYLYSLEIGTWAVPELVHPLYVPLLGTYQRFLGLWGYSGRMLLPVEFLNLAAGLMTLAGLYLFLERRCRDSLAAALSVLLLAFSPAGFWRACLDLNAYALAGAFVALSLVLMIGPVPCGAVAQFALAGAAAGLAAALHAAAVSLIPVAAFACRARPGEPRPGLLSAFLSALAATALASYAALFFWHGIGFDFFRRTDLGSLIRQVEQLPGSSIFSNPDPAALAIGYLRMLALQGGPALAFAAAMFAFAALARGRRMFDPGEESRGAGIAAVHLCSFSLFFALGNNRNGFIFASLIPMAVPLSSVLARSRGARWIVAPILLTHFWKIAAILPLTRQASKSASLQAESRFLSAALGPRDVLLLPDCPDPGVLYAGTVNLWVVAGSQRRNCGVPVIQAGTALKRKVLESLARGGRVFVPEALTVADESLRFGDWVQGRVSLTESPDIEEGGKELAALRARLERDFKMGDTLRSPQGLAYRRLAP